MFHKEGAKIILIATVIVAAWILLADEFISLVWLKMTVQTIGLVISNSDFTIFQKSETKHTY
jgi:phosphatidylserine decarboxylase